MTFLNFFKKLFRIKETKKTVSELNNIFEVNEKLESKLKALEKIEKDIKSIYK
jgi:hypothetical protein